MNKRCFISGKITGLTIDQVAIEFQKAEAEVAALGFVPVNPIKFVPVGLDYFKQMQMCYDKIDECEAIYMIHNFRDSSGALSELEHSNRLGHQVFMQKL